MAVFGLKGMLVVALLAAAVGCGDDEPSPEGGTSSPRDAGTATLFPGAVAEGEQESIDFPQVDVGETARFDVEVRNDTDEALAMEKARIVTWNGDSKPASHPARPRATEEDPGIDISENDCEGKTLQPEEQCRIEMLIREPITSADRLGLEVDTDKGPFWVALYGDTGKSSPSSPAWTQNPETPTISPGPRQP
ncbi:hypothetical protein [Streptomyces macrosporus]|uniref:hypothetical protein n=1 Tax=Streptomyces macrosporus TaxID=44032 RepID=UPI0031E44601